METTGNRVPKGRKADFNGAVADIRRDGRTGKPEDGFVEAHEIGKAGKLEDGFAGNFQKDESETIETKSPKTRADYEEDYKRAHIGLIAEFVRDAAGM